RSRGTWLGLGLHQLDTVEPERARYSFAHRLQHLGPDHLKFLQLTYALELVAHLRQLLLPLGDLGLHAPQQQLLHAQGRAQGSRSLPVHNSSQQEKQYAECIGNGESLPSLPQEKLLERRAGKGSRTQKVDTKECHSALIARPTAGANCQPS